MATSTPFAYNTGSAISGTTQVGNLSVGTPIDKLPSCSVPGIVVPKLYAKGLATAMICFINKYKKIKKGRHRRVSPNVPVRTKLYNSFEGRVNHQHHLRSDKPLF